jgi:hypothetical protein
MIMAKEPEWEPREVVIRHGLFWYFAREKQVTPNPSTGRLQEQEVLVQRTAGQNETVKIWLESDYQRGLDHHAFWTEAELAEAAGQARSNVLPTPALQAGEAGHDGEGGGEESPDPMEVAVGELDSEGLRDWLTGTGEFDGARKPTAAEVTEKIGDDAELADRMLKAEVATREKPRVEIERHVDKVQESATA